MPVKIAIIRPDLPAVHLAGPPEFLNFLFYYIYGYAIIISNKRLVLGDRPAGALVVTDDFAARKVRTTLIDLCKTGWDKYFALFICYAAVLQYMYKFSLFFVLKDQTGI